ncbi:hypothetical protein QFZ68_000188 [Streptomyces sp. V1I6]|nr:hypothetical protein [Streptomyces sp. V1I6]
MLDVSRHFLTVEQVKRYIDHLALYQPPPQPKKPMNGWAITGITIGGLVVSLFLLGAVLAAVDDTSSSGAKTPASVAAAPETSAKADAKPAEKKATPSPKAPVKKETPAPTPTVKDTPAPKKTQAVVPAVETADLPNFVGMNHQDAQDTA